MTPERTGVGAGPRRHHLRDPLVYARCRTRNSRALAQHGFRLSTPERALRAAVGGLALQSWYDEKFPAFETRVPR